MTLVQVLKVVYVHAKCMFLKLFSENLLIKFFMALVFFALKYTQSLIIPLRQMHFYTV